MSHISRCKHGYGLAECDECFPKDRLLEGWKEGYARMNKQHKWHKEICAWANGAEIECRVMDNNVGVSTKWFYALTPDWNDDNLLFRIKPQPKEPQYLYVYRHDGKPEIFTEELDISNPNRLQYIGKFKLEQDDE